MMIKKSKLKVSSSNKFRKKNFSSFPTSINYQTQYGNTPQSFQFHHNYIPIAQNSNRS